MALLFMDSFDHYVTADLTEKWTSTANGTGLTASINAAGGRRSSGSFRVTSSGGQGTNNSVSLQRTLAPADATCVIGFSFAIGNAALLGANGPAIASIRDSGTVQISLRLNPTLTLSVVRGTPAAGTVLGTTSSSLSAGVVAYIELKVAIHASAGTVDLHINGAAAMTPLTGQNTRNTANTSWNGLALANADTSTSSWVAGVSTTMDWDDLYVLDGSGSAPWNTFLGDCRVDPRYPTAEGTTTGWTPLSGTDNALMVDETAPNDDTDYNSTATVNATDTHVTENAPVAGAAIYGIQHCLSMKKSDAGTCTVSPVIRHSTTDYPGAALSPGTSYAYGLQIAQTNPGTSAQWTETDFNNAEFGYKRIS